MSRELSISVCRHTQHKHIVQLAPNAFTPFAEHPIARDCCPLILDCKDGFKVLGMGFKKFFDYNDEEAAEDLKTILCMKNSMDISAYSILIMDSGC
jgi:hypothetical protein